MIGGLRIRRNKKLRRRDPKTYRILTAMWFQPLHAGAEVRLRNFCDKSQKRGCLTWRKYRTEDPIF